MFSIAGTSRYPGGPGWDDTAPATRPASTSTLISGDGGAVLVDALLTTSEGERLAAWQQGYTVIAPANPLRRSRRART
jgi:hypothetical protein